MTEVAVSRPLCWVPDSVQSTGVAPRNRECTWRLAMIAEKQDPVPPRLAAVLLAATLMRSSSGRDTMGWSPPLCSLTPAGMCWCWKPSLTPEGAVRSAELIPGYIGDLYSAFYPMTLASPAMGACISKTTVRWSHAPAVVGHARSGPDDDAPVITAIPPRPLLSWRAINAATATTGGGWSNCGTPSRRRCSTPCSHRFPTARADSAKKELGTAEALRLARLLMLPATVMGEQLFDGDAARLLLGNALHADTPIDAPGSGVMGFLLVMLAQDSGFPVPVGGAGQLTAALVKRAVRPAPKCSAAGRSSAIDVGAAEPWPCTPATAEPFACAALLSPTCRPPACMSGYCPTRRYRPGYCRTCSISPGTPRWSR